MLGGVSRETRLALAFLPGLIGLPVLILHGPVAQDLCYHDFADKRAILGIPYFGDVVSNLPFCLVGLAGLLRRPPLDFGVFFLGVLLTGLGSGYYHLDPTNATLVWDRAPMTLGFMGFFAALIRVRVDARWGRRLLWPLVVVGLLSVWYWARTDDLRPYIMVQFYPLVTAVLLLLLLPGPSRHYWLALASYVLAKVVELLDKPIYDLTGVVSGHSIKHLFAALGAWWIVSMLHLDTTSSLPLSKCR